MWFITSVLLQTLPIGKVDHSKRTFGFYPNYAQAFDAIKVNCGNMQECLYNYLVLEYIEEGVHGESKSEDWFEWNGFKWEECNKPYDIAGIINWALG